MLTKMKILGLITEYNPFHNGHLYHIEEAKKQCGADAAIVVMSGDFVQRGTPACMPKHLRARAALLCGADMVIELPVLSATGSAEFFAKGAVSLLDNLGCIDFLCFGSESADLACLRAASHILSDEPAEFREILRSCLKQGLSFPAARQNALEAYTKDPALSELLKSPNNTLGIEYLKALNQLRSSICPFTIARKGSGYHDENLDGAHCSATAVRKYLRKSEKFSYSPDEVLHQISNVLPEETLHILKENWKKSLPVNEDDFSLLLKYRLLSMNREELTACADVGIDLANRLLNQLPAFTSWSSYCTALKTKELTYARISRSLLHILLGIRSEHQKRHHRDNPAQGMYAHILGFRRSSAELIGIVDRHTHIPLILRHADIRTLSCDARDSLKLDQFASQIYQSVITAKYGFSYPSDFNRKPEIV